MNSPAAPYRRIADAVSDNLQGQADAERFIERLRGTFTDPDELMRQALLAQEWSPDRLRGFCRALQKRIERGVRP